LVDHISGIGAMDIESVLRSKARLKILKLLMQTELLNTSEIVKQVRVSHSKAKEHLKILEDEGILTHRMYGRRIRLHRFNEFSSKAKAIRNLIEAYTIT
jgi:DNA-binding transcriptional ArsR family regulator